MLSDSKGKVRQRGFWQMGKFAREEGKSRKLGFGSEEDDHEMLVDK